MTLLLPMKNQCGIAGKVSVKDLWDPSLNSPTAMEACKVTLDQLCTLSPTSQRCDENKTEELRMVLVALGRRHGKNEAES